MSIRSLRLKPLTTNLVFIRFKPLTVGAYALRALRDVEEWTRVFPTTPRLREELARDSITGVWQPLGQNVGFWPMNVMHGSYI
jgi:hypothetical protein